MPSNKETLFQDHLYRYLQQEHGYHELSPDRVSPHHIAEEVLLTFIKETQQETYASLYENYQNDTDQEILKGLALKMEKKELWLLLRNGVEIRGVNVKLYFPQPRSQTSATALQNYETNQLHAKTEYGYNPKTQERIDLVIWLNGLPIIVMELKHEDEGQNVNDAIYDSFLKRDLNNPLYQHPFLYIASSDCEVKVATNPNSEKNFRWFNAQLHNQAETEGEYAVEHLYRDALSKESICAYLEHFLVYVPAVETLDEDGVLHRKPDFTIFPRYHQVRASREVARLVSEAYNTDGTLGQKLLVNHSAGSGKTLTIAWLADQLDSLYNEENEKVFDNIVILTDRKSLDKNIKDDLANFTHLKNKIHYAKKSRDLATHLNDNRDIIVTTIHKFAYIQERLENAEALKGRKIAFLIDEAHRSQEGRMALTMKKMFTKDGEEGEQEEDESPDSIGEQLENLDISNQVFVAFTATTTQQTVDYFGEPIDIYSELEAITEGYILDTAQNIISYETLYNLSTKNGQPLSEKEFPSGVVGKALKTMAYDDLPLIQYKSEVMMKYFLENVAHTLQGKGKAMVVASSRSAGLKYFKTLKTILEEKGLPHKVLYAFSDFTDPESGEEIKEYEINELSTVHGGKLIEEVFEEDDYRILVVANKFQTGFDQPKLTAMFLDKVVNGVTAIQTVSRLNRKHPDKEQDDILVVDFTNNSKEIFNAFNKHRTGSPFEEREPDLEKLLEVYQTILSQEVFTEDHVTKFVEVYIKAEKAAHQRKSAMDALLSNIVQEYRVIFETAISEMDERKKYVSLLKRYTKQYYFIAKFYELPDILHHFIVFAEGIADRLLNHGKTSELGLLLKNIQVSKGAVTYIGNKENTPPDENGSGNGGSGGGEREIPTTNIETAIQKIQETHNISDDDAIIIREICEEVSNKEELRTRIEQNHNNEQYLSKVEPEVSREVSNSYEKRDLWEKLEDPIYMDDGGIITLMSKSIIEDIVADEKAA